jgi:hypothetical protein
VTARAVQRLPEGEEEARHRAQFLTARVRPLSRRIPQRGRTDAIAVWCHLDTTAGQMVRSRHRGEEPVQFAPAQVCIRQHPRHHGIVEEGLAQRDGQCTDVGAGGWSSYGIHAVQSPRIAACSPPECSITPA